MSRHIPSRFTVGHVLLPDAVEAQFAALQACVDRGSNRAECIRQCGAGQERINAMIEYVNGDTRLEVTQHLSDVPVIPEMASTYARIHELCMAQSPDMPESLDDCAPTPELNILMETYGIAVRASTSMQKILPGFNDE